MKKRVLFTALLVATSLIVTACDNKELIQMNSDIQSQIGDLQSQIDEIKNQINELKNTITSLESEMNGKISAAIEDYQTKISAAEEEIATLQKDLTDLAEKLEEDKQALQDDYNDKLTTLSNTHDTDKQAIEDDYNAKITALTDAHNTDKQALEDDYNAKIAVLGETHDADKQALQDDYNAKLAALTNEFNTAKQAIEDDYNAKITALTDALVTAKQALEDDYNAKISALQNTYEEKVSEIESSIATINTNITNLQSELNAQVTAIQNDYNSKINDLTARVATLEEVQTHTVIFDTKGGSDIASRTVIHGEKVAKPTDPTKAGFTFEGWTYMGEPWVFQGYVVTEDMTIVANWEYIDYTVTFKNDDGTILETQTPVHYGDSVSYHGNIPVKPNPVDHYIYTFNGWDVDLTNITGDTVAIAQYTAEYAPYTANFYDDEDNLLYSVFVKEGETATYVGDTPTKADNDELKLQYQFSGWDEVSRDNTTITYKAIFEKCSKGLVFENGSVYQYVGTSSVIEIPSIWDDKTIVSIGSNAFENTSITSVNVPKTVELIYQFAFRKCSLLETVHLKDGLRYVGAGAFTECTSLESIVLPDSLETMESYYTIPKGEYTFGGDCGVFQLCSSLKSVNIPSHLSRLSSYAFNGCSSLEIIDIPGNIESIGEHCFENCEQLESVLLSNGLTTIGSYAFSNCSSLLSLSLPDTLQRVLYGAFVGCALLTAITIPNGLMEIGSVAFSASNKTVIFTERTYRPKDWALDWFGDSFVVWGYESSITKDGYTYAFATNNEGQCVAYLISIESSVTDFEIASNTINGYELIAINPGIFRYNTNIKTVVLPNCIKTIERETFRECTSLKTVHISDSVTSIETAAFMGCASLESINIPSGITEIGTQVFSECTSLETIVLPETLETIGMFAFYGCSSLSSIVIPNYVTQIKEYAFKGCSSLSYVVLPTSVASIGGWAFIDCLPSLKVLYSGTSEQWETVSVYDRGNYVLETNLYLYSENEPAEPGNYWRYVEGVPTVW